MPDPQSGADDSQPARGGTGATNTDVSDREGDAVDQQEPAEPGLTAGTDPAKATDWTRHGKGNQ